MAVYIKSANCPGGCAENPCCSLDQGRTETEDGPETFTDNIDVSAQAGDDMAVLFEWVVGFTDGFARFRLLADAVEIFDSGCVNNTTTDSDVVVVPGGTATLTVEVEQECSGTWSENFWEWVISCA